MLLEIKDLFVNAGEKEILKGINLNINKVINMQYKQRLASNHSKSKSPHMLTLILIIVLPINAKALYKVTHITTHSFGNIYNSQYRVTNETKNRVTKK